MDRSNLEGYSPWDNGFRLVKVLLEQGDPFQGRTFDKLSLRLMLGTFLLMGITLSNGYKNTNVYNLIAPRSRERFRELQQLIDHSVPIYDNGIALVTNMSLYRSSGRKSDALGFDLSKEMEEMPWGNVRLNVIQMRFIVIKEALAVWRNRQPNFGGNRDFYETNENRKLKAVLHNNSVFLQPRRIFERAIATIRKYDVPWKNLGYVYSSIEYEQLVAEFNKCNNIAVLMPKYVASQYANTLREKGGSIIEKIYYEMGNQLYLAALIPSWLIPRLARLKESGAVERDMGLLESVKYDVMKVTNKERERRLHNFSAKTGPISASLGGNVLVIFLILVGGLVAAIGGFLVETIVPFFAFANSIKLYLHLPMQYDQ